MIKGTVAPSEASATTWDRAGFKVDNIPMQDGRTINLAISATQEGLECISGDGKAHFVVEAWDYDEHVQISEIPLCERCAHRYVPGMWQSYTQLAKQHTPRGW